MPRLLGPRPLALAPLAVLALGAWSACATWQGGDGVGSEERWALHIVRSSCAPCHNPQGSAPFDLIEAAHVRERGEQILEVVSSQRMPPQLPRSPDGHFPSVHPHRALLPSARDFLVRWIARGAPDPEDRPPPLGPGGELERGRQPDLVIPIEETFTVPAEGNGIVRTFVFPTGFDEPRYVTDVRFDTGVLRIHYTALMIADTTGQARKFDARHAGAGYPAMGSIGFNIAGSLGGHFAGGSTPLSSASHRLPAGADIVVEVMFHPTGKPEVVRPTLGVYFEEKLTRPISTLALGTLCIDIPAGVAVHRLEDSIVLPVDVDLVGLLPKARYLCRSMRVTVTPPGEPERTILEIPDWNPDWIEPYQLFGGMRGLPAGTRVRMLYTYDNSESNAQNPHHPPRRVTRGPRPDDELCRLLLYLTPRDLNDRATLETAHVTACRERIQEYRQWRKKNR